MDEMLRELGLPVTPLQRVLLTLRFIGVIVAILVISVLIHRESFVMAFAVHLLGWVFWFLWLGLILPRNQTECRRLNIANGYRTAFIVHILPGVSFGVAQMFRPALFGYLQPSFAWAPWWRISLGFVLGCATLALLITAFRAIGLASAGFVYEYRNVKTEVVQSGAYSYLRHPLFFASVIGALSLTLVFNDLSSLYLAFLNLLALPVYQWLEDRRLMLVFGDDYIEYRNQTPAYLGVLPRKSMFKTCEPSETTTEAL